MVLCAGVFTHDIPLGFALGWTVGCGCHCWCAQSCLHNMRLSSGVADCLRVHLARRRGGARLWLSPLSAFVYSLVSLSRCRHVDTCTRLDSFLVCRSFRPVDISDGSSDDGLVHHAGLVNLAFPILRSWPVSPCGEPLVQIRRGLRPLLARREFRVARTYERMKLGGAISHTVCSCTRLQSIVPTHRHTCPAQSQRDPPLVPSAART